MEQRVFFLLEISCNIYCSRVFSVVFFYFKPVFISRSVDLLIRAYVTYARPLVEHDTLIWSPYTVKDTEAVETVQRRFTKLYTCTTFGDIVECSGFQTFWTTDPYSPQA